MNILGVKIDNLTKPEVLQKISEFLQSDNQHQIVTVNPEFIMAAQHDDEFRNILNKADLSVADGVGLKFAAKRFGQALKERITGVDLVYEIAKIAEQNNKSIYLLGAKGKVPEKTVIKLLEKYPKLKIAGYETGYRHAWWKFSDEKLVSHIKRSQADILLVAFGHPKQEKWIYHNLPKMPLVKLAMGVGGAFDYISGHVKRAPQWMRSIGLEWLYRVIRQPWRLPRIMTAVVKFSWAVLKTKKEK